MIIRLCPPPIYTYPLIHIRQIGGFILEVLSDSPPPIVQGGMMPCEVKERLELPTFQQ